MSRASRSGVKNGEGVVHKVRDFFLTNPEEELTFADVTQKFGCARNTAENAVKKLKNAGLIESVHVIRLRAKGVAR